MSSSERYYAESQCDAKHASGKREGERCTNKCYYIQGSKYLCGVHSNINKRKKLEKNPDAKEMKADKLKNHEKSVEAATERNKREGRAGKVICSKIGMMTRPEDVSGYLKVFPNHKHQNRADGFGCSSLSPMKLGPVDHGQKGLPKCKLLENYHQFNKVYDCDLDKSNKLKKTFYEQRKSAYGSMTGKRHKYTGKMMIEGTMRRPRTLYSVHMDHKGVEERYTYVQSRYLYCYFYEKLVRDNKDLATLRKMLRGGTNLQIVGFDGFSVIKDLMFYYTDTSKPFGHEMVLYTLLTETDPKQYPWNKYYEMCGKQLYPDHLKPDYMKPPAELMDVKEKSAQDQPKQVHKEENKSEHKDKKQNTVKLKVPTENPKVKRQKSKPKRPEKNEDIQDISDSPGESVLIEEFDSDSD